MLQTVNSLTPVKQVSLTANSAAVFSKVESVVKEPALPPPASPMIRAFSIPSPSIKTPLKSSTPVGKSQLRSPCAHVSPSPGGDRKCTILSPINEDNALNTSISEKKEWVKSFICSTSLPVIHNCAAQL